MTQPTLQRGACVAGRYRIEGRLGAGAMGTVYDATQLELGRRVALKVLKHEVYARMEGARDRFYLEARAASAVRHEGVVQVLDYGEDDAGTLFIAMERVDGTSLHEVLARGPLGQARLVDLAGQLLAALEAAHRAGVVHRDVKPENIMLVRARDADGHEVERVKILDFGLAKVCDRLDDRPVRRRLTIEGVACGTPAYMSPEQVRGLTPDARADLYAVGVLLYQMATGTVPFEERTDLGTLVAHVMNEPTPPRALRGDLAPGLEAVILRALEKNPADRYASAQEMRAALFGRSARALMALADTQPRPALSRGELRGGIARLGRGMVAAGWLAVAATVLISGG